MGGVGRGGKTLLLWVLLVGMFLAIWQVLQPSTRRTMTDQDCQQAPSCKWYGLCKFRGGRCVAESDEDCKQSEGCARLGHCTALGGLCRGDTPH